MRMARQKGTGFTLVELIIVVAIIGLLALIAIPNLIRAKLNANEAAVRTDLRTFNQANDSFHSAQNPPVFAASVSTLTAANPPYLGQAWDNAHVAPGRHGYLFNYTQGAGGSTYALVASPTGNQGVNTYCLDHTGVVVGSVRGSDAPVGSGEGCSGGTPVTG